MVKRVEAGSSKGGEFVTENKGKVAPTTKIEQSLIDSLAGYNSAKERKSGSSGYQYGTMFKRFEEAKGKVEADVSKATRGHDLSESLVMFKKIEEDTMREASNATLAANAFSTQVSDWLGEDSPVVTTIFKVAMEETNEKAEQLTLKYLAAVEARRAFEGPSTEEVYRNPFEADPEDD